MANTMRREIPELWTDQMETFLGKRETPSTRSTSIPLTRETRAVGTAVSDRAGFTSNANTMRREIPELWTNQIETFLGKRENPFMGKA
jgi:hypothetical protein